MPNTFKVSDDIGDAEFLCCPRLTTPLLLADNKIGKCDKCGYAVQFRPHLPAQLKPLCMECAGPMINDAAAKGELEAAVSRKSAAEIALWQSKPEGEG